MTNDSGTMIEQIKMIFGSLSSFVLIIDRDYNLLWENSAGYPDLPENLRSAIEKLPSREGSDSPTDNEAIISLADKKTLGMLVPLGDFLVFIAADSGLNHKGNGSSAINRFQVVPDTNDVDIIYSSNTMKETMKLADKVSDIDATILLNGETGVGKTVLAKYIHNKSPRKNAPFVSINCGAIPATLVESELFGYEKGAFTGAYKTGKVGLFETAIGGTVLLDEVSETSKDIQVKILHAIEEKKIVRVGGRESIPLDIRLIAATNRDLAKMVSDGDFREDLYYRLNVISFTIPPLRERKEDIMELSKHFLRLNNKKYNLEKELDPGVMKILMEYKWPGNVRELQNSLERMIVMSSEDMIRSNDLPANIISFINRESSDFVDSKKGSLQNEKDMLERDLIQKALTECKSIRKAAVKLGVSHVTLLRKIERLNMRAVPQHLGGMEDRDAQ